MPTKLQFSWAVRHHISSQRSPAHGQKTSGAGFAFMERKARGQLLAPCGRSAATAMEERHRAKRLALMKQLKT